ncbi:prefoldin subunit alpha [Candidatus Woesearchaeota archaeon]|nr:prefoldin subunit alpha [Candidatus Woesearchaeota archaeon]
MNHHQKENVNNAPVSNTKQNDVEAQKQLLQEKYMEYQMFEQQKKAIEEQLQTLVQQLQEAMNTVMVLDSFSAAADGSEVLIPVSNGIFAKASLMQEQKVAVNVGANIVVEKTVDEAKQMIEQQIHHLSHYQKQFEQQLDAMAHHVKKLEQELTKLIA